MVCAVFNLITTTCKSDYILAIIRVRIIKYMFMRVTIQILYAALETLMKSRLHSLYSQAVGCVTNSNPNHNRNVLYPAKIMSKFTILLNFCLTKRISCSWKCSHELLFVHGVSPKSCISLSKFSSWEPFIY